MPSALVVEATTIRRDSYKADGHRPSGANREPVPLSSPDLTDEDRDRVLAILNGRTLSLGPVLPAFEEALAEASGTRYAVAVKDLRMHASRVGSRGTSEVEGHEDVARGIGLDPEWNAGRLAEDVRHQWAGDGCCRDGHVLRRKEALKRRGAAR